MRLLLFNLATDANDPALGFTTRWISALAERLEFVHVITMRAGHLESRDNVRIHSIGKEKGYSEVRRAVEFYRILFRILKKDRIDVCFSHMIPIFTLLAAPVLQKKRIPIVTWYAHPSLTLVLKMAHHVSERMVASVATAYPYRHDKLTVVGQGIDTDLFSSNTQAQLAYPPVILCVGRLSPVKDHPTLLKATSLLRDGWNKPFRVAIVGGPVVRHDEAYVCLLHEQVRDMGLEDTVCFEPPVPFSALPLWYRRCTLHVNLAPPGSGDKVVWEAMSCGKISFAANDGFRATFGQYADELLFRYRDAEDLAARLRWGLSLTVSERERAGMYLSEQVKAMHSINRLSAILVELFARCVEQRSTRRSVNPSRETTP